MEALNKIPRFTFLLRRTFHCPIQDTYPPEGLLRNKPKVSPPANYELLPGMSPKVFRETDYEKHLGPIPATGNDAKDCDYKNPEYFSYHNYSFYDIGRAIGCAYRAQPSSLSKRDKPFRAPWQRDEPFSGEQTRPNCFPCGSKRSSSKN